MKNAFHFSKKDDAFFIEHREKLYSDPKSCLKAYHDFLNANDIDPSFNREYVLKKLKGRYELSNALLQFYQRSILENERICFLEDLHEIGQNDDLVVRLALDTFHSDAKPKNLWEYGDLLYSIKNYDYLNQYIEIAEDEALKEARQMIVLLLGKSKNEEVIPVLKKLLYDNTVQGHALEALSHFSGNDIVEIMHQFKDHETMWIRKTAVKYLKKSANKL